MKLKTFIFNPFAVNTYLVYDETKECVIIDPACVSDDEKNKLVNYIIQNKLKPVAILNTHGHVDHVAGEAFVKKQYQIPIYAHKADSILRTKAVDKGLAYGMQIETPPTPDHYLEENDSFKFGNSEFKILHLPGHSLGSIAFYSEKDSFIIDGDVLFNGSIGRTDFEDGDLDVLMHSITKKLFALDDNTVVYSGHGPETTIGNEVRSNPFLLDNVL